MLCSSLEIQEDCEEGGEQPGRGDFSYGGNNWGDGLCKSHPSRDFWQKSGGCPRADKKFVHFFRTRSGKTRWGQCHNINVLYYIFQIWGFCNYFNKCF